MPFTSKVYKLNVLRYQDDTLRKAGVDAPGALHYIVVREIERAMVLIMVQAAMIF
jgi:hypothetical protein